MAQGRVLIVDDDAAIRDSVRALLESAGLSVEDFASAAEFLSSYTHLAGDCLVADIRMPDMDGLELQEELVRRAIDLPVIIVTGHGDVPRAVRAMKAGAVDFIEKPFDDEQFLASVHRAGALAHEARERLGLAREAIERIANLTARERQVLAHLVAGRANKVIAYELEISPRTVEIHRARLMDKMRARSLADLVRLALAAGIATPD